MIKAHELYDRYLDIKRQPNEDDLIIERMSIEAALHVILHAYDILYDKEVDIAVFIQCKNSDQYNRFINHSNGPNLTTEEFDILYSVFRNKMNVGDSSVG